MTQVVYVNGRGGAWFGAPMAEVERGFAALRAGLDRLAQSDAACLALLARATPPARCSAAIPVSPARADRAIAEVPCRAMMTQAGPRVVRDDGGAGDRVRLGDAFDVMEDLARRKHPSVIEKAEAAYRQRCKDARAAGKKKMPVWHEPAFVPPISPGQVQVGRDYAALTERVATSGLKCSSLEAQRAGGSGGGDREEAVLQDIQQLRAFHARIGCGLAKEVRRIRPGGAKRRAIRVRVLVDQVCIGGMTLSEVLEAHGWGVNAKSRNALRASLCAALDRMRGYDLVRPAKGLDA